MAVRLDATRFEATSPVARYWLAQCTGFRVQGAAKGKVEEIVSDSDPRVPETLIVRTVLRTREIPVSTVEAVIPAEQLIVLGGGDARREQRKRRRPRRVARRAASRTVSLAKDTALEHGPSLGRKAARASRRVAAFLALAAVAVVRLVGRAGASGVRASAAAASLLAVIVPRFGRRAGAAAVGLVTLTQRSSARAAAAWRGFALSAASSLDARRAQRRPHTGPAAWENLRRQGRRLRQKG
jgi:hypothetical protein